MSTTASARRSWRGRAIVAISALHAAFTIALGSTAHRDETLHPYLGSRSPWTELHPGFGADVPPKLWLLSLVWSLFFGATLALLGALVHSVERSGAAIPRTVSVSLLVFALVGGVMMPASGFWLLAVVAAAMVRRP